jgi:hypothetical protein
VVDWSDTTAPQQASLKKNEGFTEMISKSPRKTIFGDQ